MGNSVKSVTNELWRARDLCTLENKASQNPPKPPQYNLLALSSNGNVIPTKRPGALAVDGKVLGAGERGCKKQPLRDEPRCCPMADTARFSHLCNRPSTGHG